MEVTRRTLAYPALLVLGLIALGMAAYPLLEGWSWVDALFFSVGTLTTVGFGNPTPSTDASKLFTTAYMLVGVGITFYYIYLLGYYVGTRALHPKKHGHANEKPKNKKKRA